VTPATRASSGNYAISRPAGTCSATGEIIEPGTAIVATLRTGDEGLERHDYLPDAWERLPEAERGTSFAHWHTRMPETGRAQAERRAADDETLIDLLDELAGTDDPDRRAFRFVLALLLMRRRKLRFVTTTADGAWQLRRVGGQVLTVEDPHLDEATTRRMMAEIEALLRDGIAEEEAS
jgi:hypothetical protein